MGQQNLEQWFLTSDERREARIAGVQAYLAEKIGTETCRVQILTAKNEHILTADELIGHLAVRMDWTTPDGLWHMRNLRFNGEMPYGFEDMPDEHVALLGGFAMAREVLVRDYAIDHNGLPLNSRTPEIAVIATVEPAPPPTLVLVAA